MNRAEFLAALSLRLQDISPEETEEAVKYYSEYLDEVGPENEENAIAELGGAEKVANIIRANCGAAPLPKPSAAVPELTLDPPLYAGVPHAPSPQLEPDAPGYTEPVHAETAEAPFTPPSAPQKNNSTRILWLIIIVASFPIWIGLLSGIFATLVGIIAALVGIVFSGFGLMLAGFVAFFAAVATITVSTANALVTMGLCLLSIALGAVIAAFSIWGISVGIPFIFKGIGYIARAISRKVGP